VEIDLERVSRAVVQLGAALEEARNVVRPGPPGEVRIRAEDRVIELPTAWAVAGVVAFAAALLAATLGTRSREREEEPLGIG